mmetsp:Transcript_12201/g.45405  ORF Transcript_12201/g.45405 Transcript_12201/m.45405 type:complete len:285 (-) Transcript_12201:175-1029(-)
MNKDAPCDNAGAARVDVVSGSYVPSAGVSGGGFVFCVTERISVERVLVSVETVLVTGDALGGAGNGLNGSSVGVDCGSSLCHGILAPEVLGIVCISPIPSLRAQGVVSANRSSHPSSTSLSESSDSVGCANLVSVVSVFSVPDASRPTFVWTKGTTFATSSSSPPKFAPPKSALGDIRPIMPSKRRCFAASASRRRCSNAAGTTATGPFFGTGLVGSESSSGDECSGELGTTPTPLPLGEAGLERALTFSSGLPLPEPLASPPPPARSQTPRLPRGVVVPGSIL